jgi:hypothetical protein
MKSALGHRQASTVSAPGLDRPGHRHPREFCRQAIAKSHDKMFCGIYGGNLPNTQGDHEHELDHVWDVWLQFSL